jgi:hypothetical protein
MDFPAFNAMPINSIPLELQNAMAMFLLQTTSKSLFEYHGDFRRPWKKFHDQ